MTYVDGEPFVEEPPSQYHAPESEALLQRVHALIASAKPVPLSSDSRINKDEVLDLLEEALTRLPEELRAARWLLKERDDFLTRTEHEADAILDQARTRVERMITRTEVVKAAEHRAYAIVDAAEVEARRMRHEVEDFCDQQLARFEVILERTMKMVAAGREKLQTVSLSSAQDYLADPDPDTDPYPYPDPGTGGAAGTASPPAGYATLPPPPPAPPPATPPQAPPSGEAAFFDQDTAG